MIKRFFLKILTALTCLCLVANIIPEFNNTAMATTNNDISDSEDTTFYYIDTNGDNNNDGSFTAPLKDLYGLKNLLYSDFTGNRLTNNNIEVIINEGIYYLDKSFSLDYSDFNLSEYNLSFVGNGNVTFTGSVLLDSKNFTPISINGVNLYKYDLSNYDLGKYCLYSSPELFINNSPCNLARYPNSSYLQTSDIINNSKNNASFKININDNFSTNDNTYLFGYISHDYRDFTSKVKIDSNVISIESPLQLNLQSGKNYYLFNNLSFLDCSNEYYIDYNEKTLYIYPDDYSTNNTFSLSLTTDNLINLTNCKNISFTNLSFYNSIGTAINIENSDNISLSNIKIENIEKRGINLNNCVNCLVKNNCINNIGSIALYLNGGNRNTLTSANIVAKNNTILNSPRLSKFYKHSLQIYGVGIIASDNTIKDSTYSAVFLEGNNITIENNDISNVCSETNDVGAIYAYRDWTQRGNVIKGNYIHDIWDSLNPYAKVVGIYLDDCYSGALVYGNKIKNVQTAMLFGGGRDNTIINNHIIDCKNSIEFDDRGLTWINPTELYSKLKNIPYDTQVWKEAYPEMQTLFSSNPLIPYNNKIYNNIIENSLPIYVFKAVKENGEVNN